VGILTEEKLMNYFSFTDLRVLLGRGEEKNSGVMLTWKEEWEERCWKGDREKEGWV